MSAARTLAGPVVVSAIGLAFACGGGAPPVVRPSSGASGGTSAKPTPARRILGMGSYRSCFRPADGLVRCFGVRFHEPTSSGFSWPSSPSELQDAGEIAFGVNHACLRTGDGEVRCWGHDFDGQLGDGVALAPSPYFNSSGSGSVAASGLPVPMPVPSSMATASVSSTPIVSLPKTIPSLRARAVAAGWEHTCVLRDDGTVACFGYNGFGQLGDGTTVHSSTPVTVAGLRDVVAVAVGFRRSHALRNDGTVVSWGGDLAGNKPFVGLQVIAGLADVVEIGASTSLACAREKSGVVLCWGDGLGVVALSSVVAAPVPGLTNAVEIAVGPDHVCARIADGTVRCAGRGDEGQLGQGTLASAKTAVEVKDVTHATDIAASQYGGCAFTEQGQLWCWGRDRPWTLRNEPSTASSASAYGSAPRVSRNDPPWAPVRVQY